MDSDGNVAIETSPAPADYLKLRVYFSSTEGDGVNYNYTIAGVNNIHTSLYPTLVHHGLYGSAYCSTAKNASQAYGVYGQAGNVTNGFNYGVYGKLLGSNNGAGVFGVMSGRGATNTSGNWAGFFNGDVKITDTLTAYRVKYYSLVNMSDQRIKKNIAPLATSLYSKVSQLNAVEFKYKSNQELIVDGILDEEILDTTNLTINAVDNRIHYGYIAQDVQLIFPELVYMGQDSILGVDYLSLVPLIIEVLKQQNDKIDDLEMLLNNCCKSSTDEQQLKSGENNTGDIETNEHIISVDLAKVEQIILYQNEPNPFNGTTVIRYYIPENIQIDAFMAFYDAYGNEIKKVTINETGAGKIEVNAHNVAAGIYTYSLLVNGKVVDTKKMMKNK